MTYASRKAHLHNETCFFCLAINVRLIHETLQDHFPIQLLNENQNNLLTSRMAGRKMEYGKIEHDQG